MSQILALSNHQRQTSNPSGAINHATHYLQFIRKITRSWIMFRV